MLKAGSSHSWPEVLQAALGTRQLDAGALLRYFDPVIKWLQQQNANETLGWPEAHWVPPVPQGYKQGVGW